ncbi:MAG TPA: ROK family protein [Silvibacterium sp.]|nr:ROK family protein [Silvibacterium sp.]
MPFPHPITLAIDIGGTGMKIMALDARGNPLTERLRMPTPNPASPARMLSLLDRMRKQMPKCDRVSVGFPGVIKQGKTMTAANLDPAWVGFPLRATLEKKWRLPVHLANDAAVQGYGAISGRGVELVLTLGTGLGSALFTDGQLCPGLELAHHPWQKGKTYEDYLGRRGLKKLGKKRWNRLLGKAIEQTSKTFNWDRLYLGGGNAKEINFKLPTYVSTISNEDGLFGGVALWRFQATQS